MRFDSYHPIINFMYFIVVITCTIYFNHPIFLALAYLATFLWSVKLNGRRALIFNLCLIPCLLLYVIWYSSYHHFGVTNLWQNKIGNWITLESILVGAVRGIKAVTVCMEFSCVFATVTSDKMVYLLGRISPNLSLFFSILLRSIPRIKKQMKKIDVARQGVGQGVRQGNIFQRIWHGIVQVSIIVTWGIEHLIVSAASMKSRGYSLRGRTAFSIYRFDDRDRVLVVGIFFCTMQMYLADLAGKTRMIYDPMILWNPINVWSVLSYIIYGVLLFLPLGLQMIGEYRFKKSQLVYEQKKSVEIHG